MVPRSSCYAMVYYAVQSERERKIYRVFPFLHSSILGGVRYESGGQRKRRLCIWATVPSGDDILYLVCFLNELICPRGCMISVNLRPQIGEFCIQTSRPHMASSGLDWLIYEYMIVRLSSRAGREGGIHNYFTLGPPGHATEQYEQYGSSKLMTNNWDLDCILPSSRYITEAASGRRLLTPSSILERDWKGPFNVGTKEKEKRGRAVITLPLELLYSVSHGERKPWLEGLMMPWASCCTHCFNRFTF